MICKICGKQNQDVAKFCTCCGESLGGQPLPNNVGMFEDSDKTELFQEGDKTELFQDGDKTELFQDGDKTELFQENNRTEPFREVSKAESFQESKKPELYRDSDNTELLGYAVPPESGSNGFGRTQTPVYDFAGQYNQQPPQKKKKSGAGLFIVLIIVAVIIAAAVIAATVYFTSPSVKSKKELALGQKYLMTLDYEEAIAAFENAIEIDPKCVEAYIGLAEAYVEMDDYETAIEVLEEGYKETKDKEIKKKLEELKEEYEMISEEVAAPEAEAAATEEPALPAAEEAPAEEPEEDNNQQIINEYFDSLNEGFEIGDIFPDFAMTDHDGNTVYLSEYRGEVLYLNFFTTWCPYCFYELPDMEAVKPRANVLLVDVDPDEGPSDTDSYLAENGFSFNVNFHKGWDVAGYEIEGVPTSFVLDEYGIIRAYVIGQADQSWMDNAIDQAENGIYDDLPQLRDN